MVTPKRHMNQVGHILSFKLNLKSMRLTGVVAALAGFLAFPEVKWEYEFLISETHDAIKL